MLDLNFSSDLLLPSEVATTNKLIACLMKRKVDFQGEIKTIEGKQAVHLICNADTSLQQHLLFWDIVWECQKYCCLIYDSLVHEYWSTLNDTQRIMFFNSTKVTAKFLTAEPSTLILSSFSRKSLDRAKEFLATKAQKNMNAVIIPVQVVNTKHQNAEIPKIVYKKCSEQKEKASCTQSFDRTPKVQRNGSFEPTTRQLLLKLAMDQELVIKKILAIEYELAGLKKIYGNKKLIESIVTKTEEVYTETVEKCTETVDKKILSEENSKNIADILSRLKRIEMVLLEIQNRTETTKSTNSQSQQTEFRDDVKFDSRSEESSLASSNNSSCSDIDSIIQRLNREVTDLKDRLPTFDGFPGSDSCATVSIASKSTDSLTNSETASSSTTLPKLRSITIAFPLNLVAQVQQCVEYWTGGNVSAEANFFIEPFERFCSLRISSAVSGETVLIATEVWQILEKTTEFSRTQNRPDITKMLLSWSTTEKLLFEINAQTTITFDKDAKALILRGWSTKSIELTAKRLDTMAREKMKPSEFSDFYS